MKNRTNKKRLLLYVAFCVLLTVLDQITKYLARANLNNPKRDIGLIPKVLRLQYLENRGAAWGILQGRLSILSFVSAALVIVFVIILFRIPEGKRYIPLQIVVLCTIAGAIGNLIDRIFFGYVTDFIYFELINFPIFNVADIYVTCSVIVLAFLVLFYYTEEELEFIPFFGKAARRKDEKGESEE